MTDEISGIWLDSFCPWTVLESKWPVTYFPFFVRIITTFFIASVQNREIWAKIMYMLKVLPPGNFPLGKKAVRFSRACQSLITSSQPRASLYLEKRVGSRWKTALQAEPKAHGKHVEQRMGNGLASRATTILSEDNPVSDGRGKGTGSSILHNWPEQIWWTISR